MAEVLPSEELIEEPSDFGSLRPGTRLGRYELLVPIARGGMARVWAARQHGQRGFQKLVALKTILPHLASEPEFERMFLDEARIAAGVHHPNVCEIYELGEDQRTLYLAMEWVSGDSLARVLRASGQTEALDPRVVARVIADACAGLHAAHELVDEDGRALGVVHRDLSPHNILLSADGVAKVADFGVAKALGQLHEATSAGQLKGKIAYMAPEQVTGAGIDRRSDLFSLGCVLYEATTGVRPFRGDGDHQVMHAVLKGEFAPPSTLVRNYPPDLERIVQRAMSPQAILRFPTAERMRFALEEFLARGQLVTQSNVAQVVRARIGENIERRKERIRQASGSGERDGSWVDSPGGMTPSNRSHGAHRSGVKPSPGSLDRQGPETARAPSAPAFTPSPQAPPAYPSAPPPPLDARPPSQPDRSSPGFAPNLHATLPLTQPGGPPAPFAPSAPPPGGFPHGQAYPAPAIFDPGPLAPPMERPAPQAGAGQYVLAIGLGLVVAAVIGAGGFFAWRSLSAHEPEPAVASATAKTSEPGAPPAASPTIVFQVDPAPASLSADGEPLGGDGRTIPRPPPGKTVTIVARAPGHEDATMLVDAFTKSPVTLTLAISVEDIVAEAPDAAAPSDEAPSDEAPSDEAPSDEAAPASTVREKPVDAPRPKAKPKVEPALPDNPY